jgi:hypothetical protein
VVCWSRRPTKAGEVLKGKVEVEMPTILKIEEVPASNIQPEISK